MATIDRTTVQFQDATATRIRRIGIYTGPTSYATGGDSLTTSELALGKLDVLMMEALSNGSAVLIPRYNYTTSKLMVFDTAGAEVTAATNLSGYSARFVADGK